MSDSSGYAQDGGVLATAEEQRELETTLEAAAEEAAAEDVGVDLRPQRI